MDFLTDSQLHLGELKQQIKLLVVGAFSLGLLIEGFLSGRSWKLRTTVLVPLFGLLIVWILRLAPNRGERMRVRLETIDDADEAHA